ncbi:probable N6-adenosine-methyltransferase MT-A70-like protein [Ceratitis capitata]|uniref:probable N6-adenosine-methyltransferase MT-A70-like protein n=1 Tax=Ceratitis capitata TaxID=7213 RepID=UPI000329E179|nr:probable N6-adenosine-methyltransferase MT-A70-like protein [Ceratitis capitata]
MADAWDEIKAVKSKRNTLREKLEKRKKERAGLLSSSPNSVVDTAKDSPNPSSAELENDADTEKALLQTLSSSTLVLPIISTQLIEKVAIFLDKPPTQQVINYTLSKLAEQGAVNIKSVTIGKDMGCEVISVETNIVLDLYKELVNDGYVGIKEELKRKFDSNDAENEDCNLTKVLKTESNAAPNTRKDTNTAGPDASDDIMSLLSMPSTREKQSKQVGEEILELLTKPTAKERSVAEKFKSHGGAQVMEFCPHGTKVECLKAQQATAEMAAKKKHDRKEESSAASKDSSDADESNPQINAEEIPNSADASLTSDSNGNTSAKDAESDNKGNDSGAEDGEIVSDLKDGDADSHESIEEIIETPDTCTKLHFKKIIQSHTDESLGDCSFLNTCFHMATCKYVHYEVDTIPNINTNKPVDVKTKLCIKRSIDPSVTLYPPQWIQCDLRYLDMTVLGKFAVVMADPPWDIHMELPYGTMSDDEMRQLGVPALQDDGLIFLWVTGRAMELGRECLKLWGYERVDELIWVKTNQLQRIIRTGRTGHWLNHGKEHCLVGMKGNPKNLNRGLDCDVIVAEVRATSHKPDEIYGIIERLSPGTRKIELFGRPHNVQPNWITLGNQLDGIRLVDPELITQFQKRYPDGNCMSPAAAVVATGQTATASSTVKK